jgi:hypothetical protein
MAKAECKAHRGIHDAACSLFGNERVIEPIFVTLRPLRQTFTGNIGLKALSQSIEPDAFLVQGFHQICRRDAQSQAHVGEGFVDESIR